MKKCSALLTLSLLSATTSLKAGFGEYDKVIFDFKERRSVSITLKKGDESKKKTFKDISPDEGLYWNGTGFEKRKQNSFLKVEEGDVQFELTSDPDGIYLTKTSGAPFVKIKSFLPVTYSGPSENINKLHVVAPRLFNKGGFNVDELSFMGKHFLTGSFTAKGFKTTDDVPHPIGSIDNGPPIAFLREQLAALALQSAAKPPVLPQASTPQKLQPVRQEEDNPTYFSVKSNFPETKKMSLTYNLLDKRIPFAGDPRIEFDVPANGIKELRQKDFPTSYQTLVGTGIYLGMCEGRHVGHPLVPPLPLNGIITVWPDKTKTFSYTMQP
jgi:hypothetical protein